MKTFIHLLRDESGASIIEMGLMAPILASLLIGMVDLSFGYSEKLALEQAAQRGIERIMQRHSISSDYSEAKTDAADAAGVPASQVTLTRWLECNNVKQTSWDTVCPDGETYARYVQLTVSDTYDPFLGSSYLGANADGTYTIEGVAGIRVQ